MSETNSAAASEVAAPHRYTAALAAEIEARWQDFWDAEGTYEAPNPSGDMAARNEAEAALAAKPKKFIMDMFPYPSGAGLHVGHPLGYIATDVFARFQRMTGHNVLHTLGFDAFGLPAEQYAVQTGTHPRVSTEANIENMKAQLRALGLGHDKRRSFATIDPDYYKWTQWIFVQIFNSWYDADAKKARPIADLVAQFDSGDRAVPGSTRAWSELNAAERADVLSQYRLAYASDAPVNWCPGLGTSWPTRRSPPTADPSAATSPSSRPSCASGTCASPPTPTACWTTWTRWTGPRPSSCSSATGSAAPKAPA